jgi:hypothetical protein
VTPPAGTAAFAVAPWDGPWAGRARLEDEAATAVALLERFGDLLGVALQAAGDGDDAALDAAVAERAWITAELGPLLASLAAARGRARAADAAAAGRAAGAGDAPALDVDALALDGAALAGILDPVDSALSHARLLHERLTDEAGRRARLAIVR